MRALADEDTLASMAFHNPRPANLVGVLQLVHCDRVPTMLTGSLSRLESSWPIACVVTQRGRDECSPDDVIEIRVAAVCARSFLEQFDATEGQVVNIRGTRWSQREDSPNKRTLIDVMFDPSITLEGGSEE